MPDHAEVIAWMVGGHHTIRQACERYGYKSPSTISKMLVKAGYTSGRTATVWQHDLDASPRRARAAFPGEMTVSVHPRPVGDMVEFDLFVDDRHVCTERVPEAEWAAIAALFPVAA